MAEIEIFEHPNFPEERIVDKKRFLVVTEKLGGEIREVVAVVPVEESIDTTIKCVADSFPEDNWVSVHQLDGTSV